MGRLWTSSRLHTLCGVAVKHLHIKSVPHQFSCNSLRQAVLTEIGALYWFLSTCRQICRVKALFIFVAVLCCLALPIHVWTPYEYSELSTCQMVSQLSQICPSETENEGKTLNAVKCSIKRAPKYSYIPRGTYSTPLVFHQEHVKLHKIKKKLRYKNCFQYFYGYKF